MILWNEKISKQNIEQKIKKLKQKFCARDMKLEIICTKTNDFLKIIEQLQTVFEKTIKTTQQFRTNRNEISFFNFFRKISKSYNAVENTKKPFFFEKKEKFFSFFRKKHDTYLRSIFHSLYINQSSFHTLERFSVLKYWVSCRVLTICALTIW